MSARSQLDYLPTLDALARTCALKARIDADAEVKLEFQQVVNRSYKIALGIATEAGQPWEDASESATITPASSVITWDVIADARQWKIWDIDPRQNASAAQVNVTTDADGIKLVDSTLTTVWAEWVPDGVSFSYTAWATATAYVVGDVRSISTAGTYYGKCYRCLTAHTSGTFATDLAEAKWVEMPVLSVFEEFLHRHVLGTWNAERNGMVSEGMAYQRAALTDLIETHRAELRQKRTQF